MEDASLNRTKNPVKDAIKEINAHNAAAAPAKDHHH